LQTCRDNLGHSLAEVVARLTSIERGMQEIKAEQTLLRHSLIKQPSQPAATEIDNSLEKARLCELTRIPWKRVSDLSYALLHARKEIAAYWTLCAR